MHSLEGQRLQRSPGVRKRSGFWKAAMKAGVAGVIPSVRVEVRSRIALPTSKHSQSAPGQMGEAEARAFSNEPCFLQRVGCSEVRGAAKRRNEQDRNKGRYVGPGGLGQQGR